MSCISVGFKSILIVMAFFSFFAVPGHVYSDGTETLGPPGIDISQGTGVVAAGIGLIDSQPASFDIEVPAEATVTMALLYWEGQMSTDVAGDDAIVINGIEVQGELIGGQAFFFNDGYCSSYRADITDLDLIGPGTNTLTIEGADFTKASNGAGVLIIYDDGSNLADIQIRDGLDLAFIDFPEPRKSTVAQTYTFDPVDYDRTADLAMFFSSVAGKISGADPDRPTVIEIIVDGEIEETVTTLINELGSNDGDEWDTLSTTIEIPAGASDVTVQAFSEDALNLATIPASFTWIGSFFAVAKKDEPPPPQEICFEVNKAKAKDDKGTKFDQLELEGSIKLPDGAAPFDPDADEVTFTLWDSTFTFPAGSFRAIGHHGHTVYCYKGPLPEMGSIFIYLDFKKCLWGICILGRDTSSYIESSGTTVELTLGDYFGTDSFEWTTKKSACRKKKGAHKKKGARKKKGALFFEKPPTLCCTCFPHKKH